ncbi:GumC family protein [Edaphobacter albus]|uniref:GumC family protein n=1 Tax=Edaphobacter sp. 4G125 TaxID=2763071 RepID=UPI0016468F3C|nr:Wzz/FepE/Etk N-terminal domain-containing protein [Edaphobacter sp. 4G125]QNI37179.1 lipopolysaccharide biosynthesis protein [Edaphobacter sp. 4G125]
MTMQYSPSTESKTAETASLEEAVGIDVIDLALSLLQAKRLIALWTTIFLAIGLGISLCLKPVFTATAVIMPPQQAQSVAGTLLGQLGSLGSLGAASELGLKNPGDMYVGMLQSRVIADDLIDRFHLQSIYHTKLRTDARRVLRGYSDFEAAKNNLIYIRVKDHDPKQAAALANGYVDELQKMNSDLAVGQASQRRLFYDQQLAEEKKALTAAEDSLKETQEKTGLIQLNGQAEMTIRNIASARAEIAARQVELGVAQTYATDQNPSVIRLQQEISSLKTQLEILEDKQQHMVPGDLQIPGGQVPAVGLEYLRKLREVRYHESLFELLAKQREAASLDEAKSAPLIQVVDPAEAPERKSGPSRVLITAGLGLAGFFLSTIWAFTKHLLAEMRQIPGQAVRLEQLRRELSLGKN